MKKITKEQLITYLIDVLGYSEEDLENQSIDELMSLVEYPSELYEYINN